MCAPFFACFYSLNGYRPILKKDSFGVSGVYDTMMFIGHFEFAFRFDLFKLFILKFFGSALALGTFARRAAVTFSGFCVDVALLLERNRRGSEAKREGRRE